MHSALMQPLFPVRPTAADISTTHSMVVTESGMEYILQRVNQYVFHDPKSLMENVGAVTAYLKERVDDPRAYLHFIKTKDDQYYYVDEKGEYWRCYEFVGGFCLEAPETDQDFYESALAFGQFQQMLSDFPAHTLHETIPEFHNTIDRYRKFKEAVARDEAGAPPRSSRRSTLSWPERKKRGPCSACGRRANCPCA